MFESSLSKRKSTLANSHFYHSVVDLLNYLQRAISDDKQTDVGRSAAAKSVYDILTCEISLSVMGKLETGDEVVVSRLGTLMLCFTGKSGVQASTNSTSEKTVRFLADRSDEAASGPTVGSFAAVTGSEPTLVSSTAVSGGEEGLAAKNEKLQGSVDRADLLGDDESPLWRLVCDSCWLSFHFVRSQSSYRHLRFLAVILCSDATDRLLTHLLSREEVSAADDASSCRSFLEQMMLPLIDEIHDDDEGSLHILSVLTSVYARLQPSEQVAVAREIAGRAARNLICANFLSEVVSSKDVNEEFRCWLRGREFGKFVVELTDDVCRRRLKVRRSDEVPDKSMVNDRSMDDSHWKLLCACLTVDQASGLFVGRLSPACLFMINCIK